MNIKKMSDFKIQHEIFLLEKEQFKRKIFAVVKDCKFNGQGMRQLISEVMEEVG